MSRGFLHRRNYYIAPILILWIMPAIRLYAALEWAQRGRLPDLAFWFIVFLPSFALIPCLKASWPWKAFIAVLYALFLVIVVPMVIDILMFLSCAYSSCMEPPEH